MNLSKEVQNQCPEKYKTLLQKKVQIGEICYIHEMENSTL